jgi:hypothetical protein
MQKLPNWGLRPHLRLILADVAAFLGLVAFLTAVFFATTLRGEAGFDSS